MSNTANYIEIGTSDPEAARGFYGEVFGWDFGASNPGGYASVNENAGGLWDTSRIGGESWAVFYIEVDDVNAAIDQAVAAGGVIVRPLVDNGKIMFAHLADPAGNRFGVYQRATS